VGVAILLERALPGVKASLRGHIERAGRIARAIETRFRFRDSKSETLLS
jgi:hypothetical protein